MKMYRHSEERAFRRVERCRLVSPIEYSAWDGCRRLPRVVSAFLQSYVVSRRVTRTWEARSSSSSSNDNDNIDNGSNKNTAPVTIQANCGAYSTNRRHRFVEIPILSLLHFPFNGPSSYKNDLFRRRQAGRSFCLAITSERAREPAARSQGEDRSLQWTCRQGKQHRLGAFLRLAAGTKLRVWIDVLKQPLLGTMFGPGRY